MPPSVAKLTAPRKRWRDAEVAGAPPHPRIDIVDVEADDLPRRRSRRIAAGGVKAATLLTFAPSSKESSINSWA